MGIAPSWYQSLGSSPVSELDDYIGAFLVKSNAYQIWHTDELGTEKL